MRRTTHINITIRGAQTRIVTGGMVVRESAYPVLRTRIDAALYYITF